jgi:hypothetical protein
MIIYRYLLSHEEHTEHLDISSEAALQIAYSDLDGMNAYPKSISSADNLLFYGEDDIWRLYLAQKRGKRRTLSVRSIVSEVRRTMRDMFSFGNEHNL